MLFIDSVEHVFSMKFYCTSLSCDWLRCSEYSGSHWV